MADLSNIYFITNRVLTGSDENKKFKKSNLCSPDLSFCKTGPDRSIELLKSGAMFKELKDEHGYDEFLIYIHGFNNQPWEDIFPNTARMQKQLNEAGCSKVKVLPLVWPCDNDFGVLKDYWDDQESAEFSGKFFARAIGKLMEWQMANREDPCRKRIHIMAHSMGGRVMLKSLPFFAKNIARADVPFLFTNTFLMASDIPNECLGKGEEGHYICSASRNIVCYYANDDIAMPASKAANVKNMVFSRRMGHTGPEDWGEIVKKKVIAANCDSFNNKLDLKGHTYFMDSDEMQSPAFQHMISLIKKPGSFKPDQELIL
ncbi:alpha/beta hydrolase [Marinifilum sp. JC120]|nr:alpha/beta hydrolase [Marinifilum sp. JC120]